MLRYCISRRTIDRQSSFVDIRLDKVKFGTGCSITVGKEKIITKNKEKYKKANACLLLSWIKYSKIQLFRSAGLSESDLVLPETNSEG